jgi:tRNA (mo5U34)-methyltransferase
MRGFTDARKAAGQLAAAAASVPRWWHSIDLGHGVVTEGHKSPELLAEEWAKLRLPDLHGRSVLDVGAWDGWFSFEAERRGADRVVALDRYVWSLDREAEAPSGRPDGSLVPYRERPGLWRPAALPGKRGFDLAHGALESTVEVVIGDLQHTDPAVLGTFDVVLYLGVLYHMEDPVGALRRLRAVTGELAVIECETVHPAGQDEVAMCHFAPGWGGDPTNWWFPNLAGLRALCMTAGFESVEIVDSAPPHNLPGGGPPRARTVAHARVHGG